MESRSETFPVSDDMKTIRNSLLNNISQIISETTFTILDF